MRSEERGASAWSLAYLVVKRLRERRRASCNVAALVLCGCNGRVIASRAANERWPRALNHSGMREEGQGHGAEGEGV